MQDKSFTLIELLIVIALLGVLIATGYPSYLSHLRDARRQEAIQEMITFKTLIEEYISKNNALPSATGSYASYNTANNLYTITYTAVDTALLMYTITAVAIAGTTQVNDVVGTTNCSTLTITSYIDGIAPIVCK